LTKPPRTPFGERQRLVHLIQCKAAMLEHGEVECPRLCHRRHFLAFGHGEPQRAQQADLGTHQSVHIELHRRVHAADIHQPPAATQRADGILHRFRRRSRPQCIEHGINAYTAGETARPVANRFLIGGKDMDARRINRANPLQHAAVARDTQDAHRPHRAGKQHRAQPQSTACPVDEHGAAGTDAGLAQSRIGGPQITEAGSRLETHAIGQLDQPIGRGCRILREAAIGIEPVDIARSGAEAEITLECVGRAIDTVARTAGVA